MATAKHWQAQGAHTLTPYIMVHDAAAAIDFYKRAFGAAEISRMLLPNGKVMHAEVRLGDSLLMLSDEFPQSAQKSPKALGGTPLTLHLYVENADATYAAAVAAGATGVMPPSDQFWGDRWGLVVDPFGHAWGIATHKEDLTPEEMQERGRKAMAAMGS